MISSLTFVLFAAIASAPPADWGGSAVPLVTSLEMQKLRYLDNCVRVRGIVQDVFPDELNRDYAFLIILSESGPIYATARLTEFSLPGLQRLVNATVEATGFCRPSYSENRAQRQPRLYLGRILQLIGTGSIRTITPAPTDPFCVPKIIENHKLYPYQLQQLGLRKAVGRVLAAWGGKTALIETPEHSMMRIEFATPHMPTCGDCIEIVGHPDTDIYHINFTRAIWRSIPNWEAPAEPVRETSAAAILTDGHGTTKVDISLYGKPVRITGTVRIISGGTSGNGIFFMESDGVLFPVDVSSCHAVLNRLAVGTVLSVTGICILNIDSWRPNAVFPRITGFSLVVRRTEDIDILSSPSWWTPQRLGWSLAAALTALIIILIWTRSLSILAERRGRQLAKEQLRRTASELKVVERTRLSADLHDALSQTLSGIAMQLGAIRRFSQTDPIRMTRHLGIASRTLKSCRDEMRNLLYDLRSRVLDEPNIKKALRQILEPHLEATDVDIRFTVPRTRLSDSTARTLFCIIRELVVNAIRHGHAGSVVITGNMQSDRLLCSVEDDGSGFDPENIPGVDEGHFGLQGIRERIDAFDGVCQIESAVGKGTKVTFSLSLSRENIKENTP